MPLPFNDDFNVSPVLHREHVEAGFQAYEDIGIRAHLGMTLFDKPFFRAVPFVDEEFPKELLQELDSVGATPPSEVPPMHANSRGRAIRASTGSATSRRRRHRSAAPTASSWMCAGWRTSSTCH